MGAGDLEIALRERLFFRAGYFARISEDTNESISRGDGAKMGTAAGRELAIDYGTKDFSPFGFPQAISLDAGF